MSDDLDKIADRVQKLLSLAEKNPNEAEAAAAVQKANELLAAYNLDMAVVERKAGGKGRREEQKLRGGMYQYQRDLWKAVARLNFCLYWTHKHSIWKDFIKNGRQRQYWGTEFQHRLVGRKVNVAATKHMVMYIEQTIERLSRERFKGEGNSQFFSSSAVSYRHGLADRLTEKVYARRREYLAEEERKKLEAEQAARAAGREGVSTSTELTLSTYIDEETDANYDFIYGEGTSARWASERAAQAAANKAADEAYTRWAAANPEAARKKEREQDRKRAKRRYRGERYKPVAGDMSTYYQGYDAGASIGIDPQAEGRKVGGLLT